MIKTNKSKLSTFVRCVAAAVALAAGSSAMADNQTIAITGATTVFSDSTPFAGGFIDIKSFTGLSAGSYTFNFGFVGFGVNLFGATFDGMAVPITTSGSFSGGTLSGTLASTGAPVLFAVAGTAGPGAAYAGVLNFNPIPVPEPETYAMLLAGLGAMGFMLRRRSRD